MSIATSEPNLGSIISLDALEGEKFVIAKVMCGGMGRVYQLVPVRRRGMPVALKTFQTRMDEPAFIREVDIWISLGCHQRIARAICYSKINTQPGVIADWYNKSLSDISLNEWPSSKIVIFCLSIIEGLQYAYDQAGIIHQDIKPSNILLDSDDGPRICDFGLARFAPEYFGSLVKISPNIAKRSNSISLGPFGGTPLYMAPELLTGESDHPDIRTDIFSLGVTLFQRLFLEHPFIDPKTNITCESLRRRHLDQLINERGNEISPVVRLIVAALQTDPGQRPGSYKDLLVAMKYTTHRSAAVSDKDESAVTKAAFLRAQGRPGEATSLVETALLSDPENPLLLNSYAVQLLHAGCQDEAYAALTEAVNFLSHHCGRLKGRLYLDPVANLGNILIRQKEYLKAESTLRTGLSWISDDGLGLATDYVEFGWLLLYSGEFLGACEHILAGYTHRVPDCDSIKWLTLSAWLSGIFKDYAQRLGRHYLHLEEMRLPEAICSCLVATAVDSDLCQRLTDRAFTNHRSELESIARELGLPAASMRPPMRLGACLAVVRTLDHEWTGGKHDGLIR